MIGLFEPVCAPWKVERHPRGLLLRRDPARLGPHGALRREGDAARADHAWRRASGSSSAARRASRPTCSPVVGEAPELRNYFVAAGLNSIGILTGGGLGRVLAHWIITGAPDVDVTGFNIDRLHRLPGQPRVPAHAHRRVARHGLPVPLPDPLDADRARREGVAGPRPAGGARRLLPGRQRLGGRRLVRAAGRRARRSSALSWGRQNWFPYWQAEHEAAREGVILMDMSFMSKFLVQGRDAGRVLNHISANDVDGEPGTITYTQWLNERRHARGRPHRHQARRRALLGRRLRHRAPPRRDLDAPPPRRRARLRHRRHLRLRAAQRPGPALARAAAVASRRPTSPTRRSRSAPRARSTSASPACCASASPTSASSATSSTSRPSRPSHVYDRLVEAGQRRRPAPRRPEGAGQPAHGEGLPRLRPRHRQHRLRARGRPRLRRRPRQAGRLHRPRRGAGQEGRRPAHPPPRPGPGRRTPSRCCSTPRSCAATAARSATSAPRRTATRSAAPSAWRWSRPASRSTQAYLDAGTLGGRHRRALATPPVASIRPLYDPANERIRA